MFDGARCFGKVAGGSLAGVVAVWILVGFVPAILVAAGVAFALYHLLHFYNQLEQRDIDDEEAGRLFVPYESHDGT